MKNNLGSKLKEHVARQVFSSGLTLGPVQLSRFSRSDLYLALIKNIEICREIFPATYFLKSCDHSFFKVIRREAVINCPVLMEYKIYEK